MPRYIKIAEVDDVPSVSGKKIKVNGKCIALFRSKNEIFAINNSCPHQGADLSDRHIKDSKVVRPLHRWSFDLKTGAFVCNENIHIPTYEVKIENNEVLIRWENE